MKIFRIILVVLWTSGLTSGAAPWTQFHGSAAHEGRWDGKVNLAALRQSWSAGGDFLRSSQPIVSADGSTVFAYGDTSSGKGMIYAYDAPTGRQLWTTEVKSNTGYWSCSSPVFADGFVYWTGGSSPFTLYKINAATGTVEWTKDYTGSIVNASPTVAGGILFISTYGGFPSNATHMAINLADGSVAWTASDGGGGQGAMAYDAHRNLVYQTILENAQHKLRAYDAATGAIAWTATWATANRDTQSGIAFDNDRIIFQDYNFNGDGYVYVANAAATGNLLWSAATPCSGDSAPAVAWDGSIYVFGDYNGSGRTRGFDSNGNIQWTFAQAGGWVGAPACAEGYVFAGDQSDNLFYLLNAQTGEIVTTLIGSGPAAFGQDSFYTIGTDGALYAYRLSFNPGDANGDERVDVGDLGILAANYGGTGKSWNQGDFNGDGIVDVGDLGILAANYGKGTTSVANFEADYAKIVISADNLKDSSSTESTKVTSDSLCSGLGLTLITAILFAGLLLIKVE